MVRLQATTRAMDGQRMLRLLKDEQEGVKSRAKSASRTVEEFFGGVEVAVRRQRDLLLQELQMHSAEVTSSLDIRIRCVCVRQVYMCMFSHHSCMCVCTASI